MATPAVEQCWADSGNGTCADGSTPICPSDGVWTTGTRASLLSNFTFRPVNNNNNGRVDPAALDATLSAMRDKVLQNMNGSAVDVNVTLAGARAARRPWQRRKNGGR